MPEIRHKTLSIFLAAIICSVAAIPIVDSMQTPPEEDAEAIAPLVIFGVGILIGVVVGGGTVYYVMNHDTPDTVIDPELNLANYRKAEAEKTQAALLNSAEMANSGLTIDSYVWGFTDSYWQRSVELIAASDWTAGATYDAEYILQKATVVENMDRLYYSWQHVVDSHFWAHRDVRSIWSGDYTPLNMGFAYDYESIYADGQIYTDTLSRVLPVAGGNRVYLSATLPEDANPATSGKIYVNGTGRVTYDDGQVINLTSGTYSLSTFRSGYCTLSGAEFFGPFLPAAVNSADIQGAMALITGTETLFAYADGDEIKIRNGNNVTSSSSLSYEVTYPNKDGVTQTLTADLSKVLTGWNAIIAGMEHTVSTSSNVSWAAWQLYDSMGSANPLVSVSAIMPDLTNVTMTREQIYAMSVLAMIQISKWMESTSKPMMSTDLMISEESMDLICKGTIKAANGTVVAEDAVFTPYAYIRDQMVRIGTTIWTQPGMALVWGSTDTWSGEADLTSMELLTLDTGMTMEIDSMEYLGAPVESMILDVKEMVVVKNKYLDDHPDPTPVPEPKDLTLLVKVLFFVIAALVAVVGFYTRNPVLLLIALAIGLVAYFAAPWLAGVIV